METFTGIKNFVANPHFHQQRQQCLSGLDPGTIDPPIVEIIRAFARLHCCFTLQSCYGHFVYGNQQDNHNIEPLPFPGNVQIVEYRIAYIALCIENSNHGRDLFHALRQLPKIDPECIQFGCADWFWQQQVNSYALQVEPKRYRNKDRIRIDYQEALHIEKIRNQFFAQIEKLLQGRPGGLGATRRKI